MKRLGVSLTGLTVFVLLTGVLAGPARADLGSGPTGCATGTTCQVNLKHWVHFSGSVASGGSGNGNPVDITPPPCLWNPIGDATTGSEAITGEWGTDPAKAPTNYQINDSVQKAVDLEKTPAPGEWYELPVNPNASQAGQQECLTLPLYAWVPPGGTPPGLDIPPQTLAQLAFSVLGTPQVSAIDVNPAGNSDTNLPTFVRVTLTPTGGDQVRMAGGRAYVSVSASVPGGPTVTVWAYSTGLDITPGSGSATVYSGGCDHLAQDNGGVTLGSGASAAQMASTQANQSIDCGVTYREPGTFDLQASVGWTACWAQTADTTLDPGNCQAVPGAGNLAPRLADRQTTVRSVQAVNG